MNNSYGSLVSVVIPYYNSRFDYFVEAIESVLSQSYSNWEVIIIDDGSSEENKEHVKRYISDLGEKRISVIYLDKNYGPSVARNKGIELAKGDIITFLDSDDLHLPWLYEKLVEHFNKDPGCLVLFVFQLWYLSFWVIRKVYLTSAQSILLEGKSQAGDVVQEFKNGNVSTFPRFAMRKEVFEKIKFDPQFRAGEETDLILQVVSNEDLLNKLSIADFGGYLYRIYPSKKRVTHMPRLRFIAREMLVKKYTNANGSLVNKILMKLEGQLAFCRFNEFLKEYFTDGSLFRYLWNVLSKCNSTREKVKGVKILMRVMYNYKFLVPIFGIESGYLSMLFDNKNNGTKTFGGMFQEHAKAYKDERAKFYAMKLFKKIF